MATRGKRHRRSEPRSLSIDATLLLERLAREGWSPAKIYRELRDKFGGDIPTPRTIQRAVHAIQPADKSAPWSLTAANGEEAALVLPVLGAVLRHTDGRIRSISQGQAAWIVSVRRAAPRLDPWQVWLLCRQYMLLEGLNEQTASGAPLNKRREAQPGPQPERPDTSHLDAWLALTEDGLLEDDDSKVAEHLRATNDFNIGRLFGKTWPHQLPWHWDEYEFMRYADGFATGLRESGHDTGEIGRWFDAFLQRTVKSRGDDKQPRKEQGR
jgi:hypothetical protein